MKLTSLTVTQDEFCGSTYLCLSQDSELFKGLKLCFNLHKCFIVQVVRKSYETIICVRLFTLVSLTIGEQSVLCVPWFNFTYLQRKHNLQRSNHAMKRTEQNRFYAKQESKYPIYLIKIYFFSNCVHNSLEQQLNFIIKCNIKRSQRIGGKKPTSQ